MSEISCPKCKHKTFISDYYEEPEEKPIEATCPICETIYYWKWQSTIDFFICDSEGKIIWDHNDE